MLARSYFTTADMSGLDEYDYLIYPGFMRRPMARWNEDGSVAPMARARGPKGEAFQLTLKQSEIDEDIAHIEYEVSALTSRPRSRTHSKRDETVIDRSAAELDHVNAVSGGRAPDRTARRFPRFFSPGHVRWFPALKAPDFLFPCRLLGNDRSDLRPRAQIGIGKKPKKKRTGPPLNPKLEAVKKQEEEERVASESEREEQDGDSDKK